VHQSDGLAIRDNPDPSANEVGRCADGDYVDVVSKKFANDGSRWLKLKNGRGWIAWNLAANGAECPITLIGVTPDE